MTIQVPFAAQLFFVEQLAYIAFNEHQRDEFENFCLSNNIGWAEINNSNIRKGDLCVFCDIKYFENNFQVPKIMVRRYDHLEWEEITQEEYKSAEMATGPHSAFAESKFI